MLRCNEAENGFELPVFENTLIKSDLGDCETKKKTLPHLRIAL